MNIGFQRLLQVRRRLRPSGPAIESIESFVAVKNSGRLRLLTRQLIRQGLGCGERFVCALLPAPESDGIKMSVPDHVRCEHPTSSPGR